MIDFVEGKLIAKSPSDAIVQVGGMGFRAAISLSTYDELPPVGREIRLWTHFQIRDEEPVLFAFAQLDERRLFLHLISISGVGPKLAITILSGAPVETIRHAITSGDSARLKTIRGIGAKTADRIVLELQKKIRDEAPSFSDKSPNGKSDSIRQAIDALSSLGFSASEAEKAVDEAVKRGAVELEDLIKQSLRK